MNDGSTAVMAKAEVKQNLPNQNNPTSVTVRLNHFYLSNPNYGYTYDRILHAAEHGIRHAIGLEHTNVKFPVMQPAGSYYGIPGSDVHGSGTLRISE